MVLSVEPRSVLKSYVFLVVTLMFGLPLLISYYAVSEGLGPAPYAVMAYIAASLAVGLILLLRRTIPTPGARPGASPGAEGAVGALRRIAPFAALSMATVAVASFGLMRYLVLVSYPYPSGSAGIAGGVYVVALAGAAALGIPLAVTWGFPQVKRAFAQGSLRVAAFIVALGYFVTYEILVNEFLVTGYNTSPGNFVQPLGTYPFAYVFTSGPAPGNFVENAIYSPYVLVQISPSLNFIFQPFELVLAVAVSVLVAATVVTTYHVVRQSERMGGACSASATLSGVGAFLGYTATCPSCLAPTLISALFGGLSSVQRVYSNVWGAVIPPVVTIAALLVSLVMLGWASRTEVAVSS